MNVSCKESLLESLCARVPQLASPGLGDSLFGPLASPLLHDEEASLDDYVNPLNLPEFRIKF